MRAQLVSESIGAIIVVFKPTITKRINALRQTNVIKIWQRNYYEHIVRNEDDLYDIIANKPLKWEVDKHYNKC